MTTATSTSSTALSSSAQAVSTISPVNLENCLQTAHRLGVARDQIERFIRAGYVPQPKQLEFHAAARLADLTGGPTQVGYGGSRGPGKSHASFAQVALDDCQRQPELKTLFLRKVGKAARESFADLRNRVLRYTEHHYKPSDGSIRFPNGSVVITGNFYNEKDIEKYLGIEYDLIVIEEATQLSEEKVKMLRGSLRTAKPNWRPRLYPTTNPGGIGHAWFKRNFIEPWRRGRMTDTHFTAGSYKDNAFLNQEYIDYLESLTGVLGRMWRDGDWDVGAGMYFINWSYETHVMRPFEIPRTWPVWCSLDYGFSHPTAVYWHTRSDNNIYTVAEHVAARWLPQQHAPAIHRISSSDLIKRPVPQLETFVAGHDVFAQKGDSQARTIAQQYEALGITLDRANIDRVNGAAEMLHRLGNPEASVAPTWFIFDTCAELIECIPSLQHDPKRPEDVLKVDADEEGNYGDDPYDGARYGLMEQPSQVTGGFAYRYH